MKRGTKIVLGLLAVVILIQLIQPTRNESNELLPTDLTRILNVPENVQGILQTACYNCHSNHTNYPWYAKVQPFGWWLGHHIEEGKEELNFSEFGAYSRRRQISKLNGVANSVKDGSMPLNSYTMMHKDARLSEGEKLVLIEWATKAKDSLRACLEMVEK